MSATADALARVAADFEAAVGRTQKLLQIPSVSTDPACDDDTRAAARWLADDLAGMGFRAELRESQGHPMVLAHHPGPGSGAPHLLYYGHYDVQPADPVDQWTYPPFDGALADGPYGRRLVARGAVDDKGQVMTFLEAFRAWTAATGSLPCQVTVLLEGEEECGSKSLAPFLEAHARDLCADAVVVSDTGAWDADTPALVTRLRGMLYTEATVRGPSHDLHSGLYGGAVTNPITALTRAVGRLHDNRGRIQIPGFYDDVEALDAATRAQWAALDFDEADFLAGVGVRTGFGEADYSVLERLWARPTADINGIYGGYTGPGSKTVIPHSASAKVSFRLVPDQDPDAVLAGYDRFLADNLPAGCDYTLETMTGVRAVRVPDESQYVAAAKAATEAVYGRPPVAMGMGGTIPAVLHFRTILGLDSVLMGFGLADDRMHSPDEKFELLCLERGIKSHVCLLGELGGH